MSPTMDPNAARASKTGGRAAIRWTDFARFLFLRRKDASPVLCSGWGVLDRAVELFAVSRVQRLDGIRFDIRLDRNEHDDFYRAARF